MHRWAVAGFYQRWSSARLIFKIERRALPHFDILFKNVLDLLLQAPAVGFGHFLERKIEIVRHVS